MPYTTEEGGRLHNFAKEPKVYNAEAPDKKQQITSLVLGVAAAALVGSLFFIAFSVSNVS